MKRIILILSVLLFAIAACNDEKGIEMDIVETGCMNGWDEFYEGSDDYKQAVTAYLEDNNIAVYSVQKSITIQVRFVWLALVQPVT